MHYWLKDKTSKKEKIDVFLFQNWTFKLFHILHFAEKKLLSSVSIEI